mgnify:CR=1 FL=1
MTRNPNARTVHRAWGLALAVGLGLSLVATAHAGDANREREALRRAQQSLRAAQDERDAMLGEKAALSQDKSKLEGELKASSARVRGAEAQAAGLRGRVAQLEASLSEQQKAVAEGQAREAALTEQLRQADLVVAQRVLPLLLAGRFDPPWVRDMVQTTRLSEAQIRSVLIRLSKTAEVYQIVKDLFYHPEVVNELAQLARTVFEQEGEVTAANFRDATGLGRKRAIQILEFFDRIGYLRRVGDIHLLRSGTALFASEK